MNQIRIDKRIATLIEDGVTCGHRTMFIVVGEKSKDQVVILHHFLSKSFVKTQPNILWCYKKDLGFSNHRKKNMKILYKKAKSGKLDYENDDPFELFILSARIRYCYYTETQKILGSTYDMCILQDFEALTPNLIARTLETVQGGGIIVFLLQDVNSLQQVYSMNMDVHQKFRTEAHQDIICRFNERFILSLQDCQRCLVINDKLEVLPISYLTYNTITNQKANIIEDTKLELMKSNLNKNNSFKALINCCKTVDQTNVLVELIDAISKKSVNLTVSLTAARGRGKSATLGLAISGAIALGYSNIYITSPSPENLKTVFEFITRGLESLNYKEHADYKLLHSSDPELHETIVRINIFKTHRQTIQYIHPMDAKGKLSLAELLVIDEAAAIPLPHVKAMLGDYLTFMASTINGYEGTGRSLTLKLLQQLREQTILTNFNSKHEIDLPKKIIQRELQELTLNEPIRYKAEDCIEKWLSNLLCLNATNAINLLLSEYPSPENCQLYYVNKDTLFSYHKDSELFLQQMMGLYVSSHYKNSPNDLQMMCDAPTHHLFCLLGPVNPDTKSLPQILVVLQICLEGQIGKSVISYGLKRGQRAAGDLIPWTVAQQFQDENFPSLSGARVVRIATHPNYQGMGYGNRALNLLQQYYQSNFSNEETKVLENTKTKTSNDLQNQDFETDLLQEIIKPRTSLPPLLFQLSERQAERLDYLGVSFGLTEPLLKFWKRGKFVPVYLRQTPNEITGEHSCILLCNLQKTPVRWLQVYWKDFRRRFTSLLSSSFRDYTPSLAHAILTNNTIELPSETLQKYILDAYFTPSDIKRLEKYSDNMSDYHLIMDLVPYLARLYYLNLMGDVHFSRIQSAILLSLGLQHKTIDQIVEKLNKSSENNDNGLESPQILGLLNRIIHKATKYLNQIVKDHVDDSFNETENSIHKSGKKRKIISKRLKQRPANPSTTRESLITLSNNDVVKTFNKQNISNMTKKKKTKKRKHSL